MVYCKHLYIVLWSWTMEQFSKEQRWAGWLWFRVSCTKSWLSMFAQSHGVGNFLHKVMVSCFLHKVMVSCFLQSHGFGNFLHKVMVSCFLHKVMVSCFLHKVRKACLVHLLQLTRYSVCWYMYCHSILDPIPSLPLLLLLFCFYIFPMLRQHCTYLPCIYLVLFYS